MQCNYLIKITDNYNELLRVLTSTRHSFTFSRRDSLMKNAEINVTAWRNAALELHVTSNEIYNILPFISEIAHE